MVSVAHPFGNPNSYNAAVGFLEEGRLRRFHTSVYQPLGMRRRFHPELPNKWVQTHPVREALRLIAARLPLGPFGGRRPAAIDWVSRGFDCATAQDLVERDGAVYCYEDSAQVTFERAAKLGVARVYELPTMHYRELRRLFEAEVAKEPGLRPFFQTLREPEWKLERKDRELLTADVIVVSTKAVRRSIERFLQPAARFVVAPYGSEVSTAVKTWTRSDRSEPLRLFFAGVLGPKKGIHILFDALSKPPGRQCHLTLAGRWEPGFREWLSKRYPINYEWLGQLAHAQVYEACRRAQVFVFPSLAEGFGLVILEAMASGIPVIATEQTAGPEILEEGADGWIVPAGDAEGLRERLESILAQRDALPDMGGAARRKAETLSWARYREQLRHGVADVLGWPVQSPLSRRAHAAASN